MTDHQNQVFNSVYPLKAQKCLVIANEVKQSTILDQKCRLLRSSDNYRNLPRKYTFNYLGLFTDTHIFNYRLRLSNCFLQISLTILLLVSVVRSHAQDTTRLSLLFAGDIMGHDSQIAAAYNPDTKQYEYDYCYRLVKPYLESADIAIGNLELTLAGPPYKGYPTFSSPDALALSLQTAGFDVLVTANNHSCDKGKLGIERTIEMLDSFKISHTGTFMDEASRLNEYPLYLEKNGFKLALLNYTYGTNGIAVPKPTIVNLIDTTQMARDIALAKENTPDFVIAFMHWGSEYQPLPNTHQKKVTEFLFKKGVALVIGAHPHVVQPMEFNKQQQQLVVYSLGNFVSGQRDRYKNGGAMVRVELLKTRKDSISTSIIDSVNYILQYVHRDEKKEYSIVPIPTYEKDSTDFLKQEVAKQAAALFAKDSRALFDMHNKQVQEDSTLPGDLVRYSILLFTAEESSEWTVRPPVDNFYGITTAENAAGKLDYYLGSFRSAEEAERVLQKLHLAEGKKIVAFRNGKPVE